MVQAAGRYSPHIVLGLLVSMALLFAGSEVAHARGAVVERGGDCQLLAEDPFANPVKGQTKVKVHTPSGRGHLVCVTTVERTEPEDGSPVRALVFRKGRPTEDDCGIQPAEGTDGEAIVTGRWLQVITPSGRAIIHCHGFEPSE